MHGGAVAKVAHGVELLAVALFSADYLYARGGKIGWGSSGRFRLLCRRGGVLLAGPAPSSAGGLFFGWCRLDGLGTGCVNGGCVRRGLLQGRIGCLLGLALAARATLTRGGG